MTDDLLLQVRARVGAEREVRGRRGGARSPAARQIVRALEAPAQRSTEGEDLSRNHLVSATLQLADGAQARLALGTVPVLRGVRESLEVKTELADTSHENQPAGETWHRRVHRGNLLRSLIKISSQTSRKNSYWGRFRPNTFIDI